MPRIPLLALIPPLVFAGLAVTLYLGMQRQDPQALPSALLGRQAPALPAAALEGYAPATDADLRKGAVTVVNFWASWCPPCRAEHPTLMAMAAEGIPVVGVNFKDKDDQAIAYLQEGGNPYLGVAVDPSGRAAVDWGVSAPPETFILAGDGTVLFRFAGPLVGSDYEQRFRPKLDAALAEQAGQAGLAAQAGQATGAALAP